MKLLIDMNIAWSGPSLYVLTLMNKYITTHTRKALFIAHMDGSVFTCATACVCYSAFTCESVKVYVSVLSHTCKCLCMPSVFTCAYVSGSVCFSVFTHMQVPVHSQCFLGCRIN